ncbi:putative ribonuclease H-like domain-containing protein [Tanacetum coccineum]
MADQDTPPPTITAMKIPIIKKGEYDIWRIRKDKRHLALSNNLMSNPKSCPQVPQCILMLKCFWEVLPIKSRFGGNEESKKMQKNVLKHQFENSVTASNETLDKAYDRFQKLIRQLEIHGTYVSKEDINQKFFMKVLSSFMESNSSNSASQNLAFLSFENTNSTNEVSTASRDFGVSTADGINQVPSTPSAHDIAYSFLAQPTTSPQLENEDFQQMDGDDLEELDLRWQVAMLTVRVKKKGHFARECRSGRSQGRRPYRNRSNAQTTESSSQALNYDTEREKHNKAKLEIRGYEIALESLEARILRHEKNELAWGERYEFLNNDLKCREIKINNFNLELEKAVKERDELKLKIEKWEGSSKNLTKILNSQMSTHDKNGLGSSDEESTLANNRFTKENKYHAVPPLITGNPLTPRADISFAGLDEYAFRNKIIESKTTETNMTVGTTNEASIVKPKSVNEIVVSKSKINKDEVIIEDLTSDDEDDVCADKIVSSVKPNVTQAVRSQADKSGQTSQNQGIGFKKVHKIKACFVCKSTGHLIKDCDFYDQKSPEPRTFNPSAVLTRAGLVNTVRSNVSTARSISTVRPVYTVRPVSTARPLASKIAQSNSVIRPKHPRLDIVRPKASNTPIKRSYFTQPVYRPKDLKPDVKTFGIKNMTTVGTRAVVSKGKVENVLKKDKWGNPEILLQDHAVVDSGCSSHMTGNKAYLSDYEDLNGGFVAFGSDPKGGKITGKGKIKTANLDFDDVYFVDELKFNLFSVSQICDKKNSILFTESECLILSPSFKLLDESQVVLRAPRKDDVYSLDLKNIIPSGGITCLYANATADESKLWHRRLGHVNFKNINKLVKGHLVRGLPSKVFVNDHTCVACKKGKQHKASCKAKLERIIRKPLELLHMDLFGPVSVESINKKRYCLVVTDDFSRFSWVFFLATKDETSEILCKFIIGLENQLNHNVKIIRCDNGTEFKNHAMNEFCAKKGIKREFSVARTPQQNGVAERKNRTLIEAARTMLADSLLPIPFWAEAVNTACYVLNRVLVTKPQNKTPYELLIGNSPSISFMRPFGCPLTILNTLDSLGKFDGKSDEGYLLGYSTTSKAFRVYNKRTKRVEENLHINFLEDQPNVAGTGPNWMFDLDFLTNSMNYIPVSVENQVNMDAGTQDSYVAGSSGKDKEPTQEYILLPLHPHRTRIPVEDVAPAAHENPS